MEWVRELARGRVVEGGSVSEGADVMRSRSRFAWGGKYPWDKDEMLLERLLSLRVGVPLTPLGPGLPAELNVRSKLGLGVANGLKVP